MSMLGLSALNDIVKSLSTIKASLILDQLNEKLQEALHQGEEREINSREGMDLALCILELKTNMLQFAGAHNPMYYMRNNHLTIVPADSIELGSPTPEVQKFTNNELQCEEDDFIYLFTDGFPDQFGGPDRKRYTYQRFREFLLTIHNESPENQKLLLENEIETWRGDYNQIDDMLVMGVKIPAKCRD